MKPLKKETDTAKMLNEVQQPQRGEKDDKSGRDRTSTSTGGATTETGGSSPGGASTGGVGSGIGGAGTGGAATGGASTGGAGTVTVTISGNSGAGSNNGGGKKKKGGGKEAPITLNISNVGGRTDAGNVASGDGPGAHGTGGSGEGSGGGGGGAAPAEPDRLSTSKDGAKMLPSATSVAPTTPGHTEYQTSGDKKWIWLAGKWEPNAAPKK